MQNRADIVPLVLLSFCIDNTHAGGMVQISFFPAKPYDTFYPTLISLNVTFMTVLHLYSYPVSDACQ